MAQLLILPELPVRITARGAWLHGDEPLHPRVEALFARHVIPLPSGDYDVCLSAQARQRLEVEDTAFFVRAAHETVEKGALVTVLLRLSDGVEEPLDPTTLMQSSDNVLYCRINRHSLRVPCRFTSAQYHSLATWMDVRGGQASLTLQGKAYVFGAYDAKPQPA